MKLVRIFLFWALLLGSPCLVLGQQSKDRADKENKATRQEKKESKRDREPSDSDADDDDDDSEYLLSGPNQGGNGRRPDAKNRNKNLLSTDSYEAEAVSASEAFASDYGITDAKERNELLKACRKYYRAKELLDAQFTDRESEPYRKKAEILEREYSKELRRVLPES